MDTLTNYEFAHILDYIDDPADIACMRAVCHEWRDMTPEFIFHDLPIDAILAKPAREIFNVSCQVNSLSLAKYALQKDKNIIQTISLSVVCMMGCAEIADLLIDRGINISYDRAQFIFSDACRAGNLGIINIFLTRKLGDINIGFRASCCSANVGLARMFLARGASTQFSLYSACYGGSHELVDLVITGGSHNWDDGLRGACDGGHLELAHLMISKGAQNINEGFMIAQHGGRAQLVDLLTACGGTYEGYRNDIHAITSSLNWGEALGTYTRDSRYDAYDEFLMSSY